MSSSTVLGVSSTPYLEVSSKRTTPPATTSSALLSLPLADKSHFNALIATSSVAKPLGFRNGGGSGFGFKQSLTFVPSAIATPNTVLSEEAFKRLGEFSENSGSLDGSVSDEDYESQTVSDEDELAISKLGLPGRLAESLEKRGITHLFPIQVTSFYSAYLRVYLQIVIFVVPFSIFL